MAAPQGNEFWRLRSKHGRDRKIKSPEELATLFDEYQQLINDNPFEEQDWVGKDAIPVIRFKKRPMLKPEFAVYCGLCEWNMIAELKKVSNDFSKIVTHIESTIASHNIAGSAAGFLNSNIIARVEGLSDKRETNVTVSEMPAWMKDE